jgi:hypothetical protein
MHTVAKRVGAQNEPLGVENGSWHTPGMIQA